MGKQPANQETRIEPTQQVVNELTIEHLERLVDKFKIERIFYLSLIGACSIILLAVATISFIQHDWKTGLAILGPSGGMSFCFSKVFKIWDDIMKIISPLETKKK